MDIDNGKTWIPGDINVANSNNYGIKHALFPFEAETCLLRPSVEHGLILYEDVFQDVLYTAPMTCATMGPFRTKIIQSTRALPVFTVGPYIQYANSFYDDKKIQKMKHNLGSTLLVFPAHSTDLSNVFFDERNYIERVKEYASMYDTTLVCSFWWNINDRLIKHFESEGFKIVSAGFRDDISFLPRLKTIILLADLAIGNNIGTHVGYCYNLKTPFKLINTNYRHTTLVQKEKKGITQKEKHLSELKAAMLSDNSIEIDQLMKQYWGNGICRTINERKIMCEVTSDITKLTRGFFSKTPIVVPKLLQQYKSEEKIDHFRILYDSYPENRSLIHSLKQNF